MTDSGFGARLLLDAREYAPSQTGGSWKRRYVAYPFTYALCRRCLPLVDAMITVSEGVASMYAERFGVGSQVLTNASFSEAISPSPVSEAQIRMIHDGVAASGRRPENMIELMSLLDDRFTLDFMFIPWEQSCSDRLAALSERDPRISFRPPVRTAEIAKTINQYDIGLLMCPPHPQTTSTHYQTSYLSSSKAVRVLLSCHPRRWQGS